MSQQNSTISIGSVAKRSGFSIDTIRFYERSGLLPEPERKPSGYRIYRPAILVRLHFIQRAKELGFTLEQITELLALSQDSHNGVEGVRHRTQRHLAMISQRIDELTRIRDSLSELVDACPGHGSPDDCPILNALTPADEALS